MRKFQVATIWEEFLGQTNIHTYFLFYIIDGELCDIHNVEPMSSTSAECQNSLS